MLWLLNDAIQMGTYNICLYEEEDKQYTGCNLKITELLDCALIRVCVAIRSIDWLCWGLTTRQPLRVILCRLPEKGRKEIEERVEEMKERDREERGTGKKVKKQKK